MFHLMYQKMDLKNLKPHEITAISDELKKKNDDFIYSQSKLFLSDSNVKLNAEKIVNEFASLSEGAASILKSIVHSYNDPLQIKNVISRMWENHKKSIKLLYHTRESLITIMALESESLSQLFEKMRVE